MNKEFFNMLENLVDSSKIVIDRPKNSYHPRFQSIIYLVDYGYLSGTKSMDNGGIDCWVGSLKPQKGQRFYQINGIMVTLDKMKQDSEIKVLINCTDTEIDYINNFHNIGNMKGILIRNE